MRDQIAKLAEVQKKAEAIAAECNNELMNARIRRARENLDAVAILAEFDRLSKRITELEAGLCELLDEQVICDEPFDERFCSAHGTKHCHMREIVPRLRALLAKQARQARGGGK